VSFFTAVSVLGVAIGVMVLLAVQSVMNGFQNDWRDNLIRAQGNINIRSGGLIDHPEEVVRLARGVPGVTWAEPYALGVVMLQFQNHPAFPAVKSVFWPPEYPRAPDEHAGPTTDTVFPDVRGYDLSHPNTPRPPVASSLVAGSFDDLDDNSVLLGFGLAEDLGVQVGDTVEVYTPLMLDRLKHNEVLLPRELRVAGIFQTGWSVADDNTIAITMRTMQDLYGLDGEVHGIEVRVAQDDEAYTENVAQALNAKLAALNAVRAARGDSLPLRARTWLETNSDLMEILLVEKTVMFYIMIFIVVVAAFSIASSLVTSVVRKTREIGLLGALGARPAQVALVFCLQGFIIGVAGTALGVLLAVLVLHYRQSIIDEFVDRRLLVEFYKFLSFPVEYRAGDFVRIIVFTLLITTLAGLLPAWRAARLKPAECLRNE
jgi:lipoprotein-releasing system permease protein